MMEAEGCYIGRNEQIEKFEENQRYLRLARGGLREALEKLPWFDEWRDRLSEIVDEYNDTPQPASKKIKNMTPNRAFGEGTNRSPLRKLEKEMEYLLWSHQERVKIGKHGLRVTISGTPWYYASEGTGRREGQEVIAYWNIEDPSYIIATDLDGSNPFIADNLHMPANTASPEDHRRVARAQSGHLNQIRGEYLALKQTYHSTITRDSDFSRAEKAHGRQLEQKRGQAQQRNRARQLAVHQAQRRAADLGIDIDLRMTDEDLARRIRAREMELEADSTIESSN
ncbi:hypothetical protein GC207_14715 [bacterium]|nr:hypothetical protein [bacterium]